MTLPSFAGLTARHYLERFDAPRESLAKVAVKNHENGVDNPKAQFRKEIDEETALESPIIADPLRLNDFCPITDGSAALMLCPEDVAREYTDDYVVVSGVDGATDTHVVHEREDPTISATRAAPVARNPSKRSISAPRAIGHTDCCRPVPVVAVPVRAVTSNTR